jgi:hypothetical protein
MRKINRLKGVMTHPDIRTIVRIKGGVRLHSSWDRGNPSLISGTDLEEKVMP